MVVIWLESDAKDVPFCNYFRVVLRSLYFGMQKKYLDSTDLKIIEDLKKRIELIAGLNVDGPLKHRDYEFLVFFIEDYSGNRVSLSTLKRIWRNEYQRLPHVSTLDILAHVAYQQPWLALKKQQSVVKPGRELSETKQSNKFSKRYWLNGGVGAIVLFAFTALYLLIPYADAPSIVVGQEQASFACKQSITSRVPNSVVFSYDVRAIDADSFFIQQSWDEHRRVKINPQHTIQTDIYYIPGYFTAQLFANTRVVKEIPVHIIHNDWFIAVRQPLDTIFSVEKSYWLNKDHLGIDPYLLDHKISLSEELQLSFYRVQDFEVDGDHFSLHSKFRMDSIEAAVCPTLSIKIGGESGLFWIMFGQKGCESELNIIVSEVYVNGKNNDLLALGTTIYEWQNMDISVADKQLTVNLDGSNRFTETYKELIGDIKEISYYFYGIGQIDEVVLRDGMDEVKFADDFD